MTISLRADISGTSGAIQVGGVDKVTIGSTGIAAGSYAPSSITPTELSQKLTLGTAQNSTSGTSIDFTSIPSWVKRITVMLNGVSTNGTSRYLFQIGSGSVTTTGYLSLSAGIGSVANTTTNTGLITSGFVITSYAPIAASTLYGAIRLQLLSSNIWICEGTTIDSSGLNPSTVTGSLTLSGTLDRIRLTTVNGTDTFDAGSINIMYE